MYDDSLAVDKQLVKISSNAYMNAMLKFTQRDTKQPLDKLEELGLTMDSECDEICETYLVEKKSKHKMQLPSGFDQGVMGIVFSPSNERFVIYSSYDGPDYTSYYFHRAEIVSYNLSNDTGLKAIHDELAHHLYNWSIEDLFWINENTVALKVYEGSRTTTGVEGGYKYFKLQLM
ncbi:hypothetical protein [Owenweeksia hongkongensis]|uniref:hypothetical protein n=1 Tax=Owenweeksia hongkongensis TaxID=253245 RepID=UPI003A8E54BD